MVSLLELLEARGGALTGHQLWALGHASAVALIAHLSKRADGEGEAGGASPRVVLVSPSAIQFSGDDGTITFNPVDDVEEVDMYCSDAAAAPHTAEEAEKEHVFSLAATLYGAADYGLGKVGRPRRNNPRPRPLRRIISQLAPSLLPSVAISFSFSSQRGEGRPRGTPCCYSWRVVVHRLSCIASFCTNVDNETSQLSWFETVGCKCVCLVHGGKEVNDSVLTYTTFHLLDLLLPPRAAHAHGHALVCMLRIATTTTTTTTPVACNRMRSLRLQKIWS